MCAMVGRPIAQKTDSHFAHQSQILAPMLVAKRGLELVHPPLLERRIGATFDAIVTDLVLMLTPDGDVTYAIEVSSTLGAEPDPRAEGSPYLVNDATTISCLIPTSAPRGFARLVIIRN